MEHYGTLWNIMEHYGLWKSMEQIVWPVSNISITRFLPGPTLSENCFKDDLHSAEGFFTVHFSLKISGTHWDDPTEVPRSFMWAKESPSHTRLKETKVRSSEP